MHRVARPRGEAGVAAGGGWRRGACVGTACNTARLGTPARKHMHAPRNRTSHRATQAYLPQKDNAAPGRAVASRAAWLVSFALTADERDPSVQREAPPSTPSPQPPPPLAALPLSLLRWSPSARRGANGFRKDPPSLRPLCDQMIHKLRRRVD